MVEGPQIRISVTVPAGLSTILSAAFRATGASLADHARVIDQLGSDNATVRLGGVRSLERLARDHPADRQRVADQLCDYLRLSFGGHPRPDHEREVRLVAQRVLAGLLRNPDQDLTIDLTGAVLVDVDLSKCYAGGANFAGARFVGPASFDQAVLAGATFDRARFESRASFGHTRFTEPVQFIETMFDDEAWFLGAEFVSHVWFDRARFEGLARFGCAKFQGKAVFIETDFAGPAQFASAEFDYCSFDEARFRTVAHFGLAQFTGDVRFTRTRFDDVAWFDAAAFHTDSTVFEGAAFTSFARMRDVRANAHQRVGQYEPSWPPGWLVEVGSAQDGWARVVPVPVLLPEPEPRPGEEH
ncbi:pentapeptide repeat-containing protein [Lentzea sp. BCCO 10_0856]|uniref:Pentapeptide repeat-containing protein n=1 Tax=Lentzea miocenica TaxID=3095431 RepID=A0ABU4SUL5_9PSEU|nr:pentapeptide repeat-containing protein [Lentzea sp. BCCO 10_0856]MDX8029499.1 pentapeptide repeat-containing protein [Lentzea sp. BCCO 10_0856]